MSYRNRESLIKSGYQSMGIAISIDDENLELFVKSSSQESQDGEEKFAMYHYLRNDKTIWEYPKKVYLEDALLHNQILKFLKLL
jgi:hypothetical protein